MMTFEKYQEVVKATYRRIRNFQNNKSKVNKLIKGLMEELDTLIIKNIIMELQDKITYLNDSIDFYKKDLKRIKERGWE